MDLPPPHPPPSTSNSFSTSCGEDFFGPTPPRDAPRDGDGGAIYLRFFDGVRRWYTSLEGLCLQLLVRCQFVCVRSIRHLIKCTIQRLIFMGSDWPHSRIRVPPCYDRHTMRHTDDRIILRTFLGKLPAVANR
jgi:hypothetical protein